MTSTAPGTTKPVFSDPLRALADIRDGATVMIGGFGVAGQPVELIDALIDHGPVT